MRTIVARPFMIESGDDSKDRSYSHVKFTITDACATLSKSSLDLLVTSHFVGGRGGEGG